MESQKPLDGMVRRLIKRFSRIHRLPSGAKRHGRSLSDNVIAVISDAILVTDHKLRIVDVNPAFTRITGYSRDEVIGQTPSLLASGQHDQDFYKDMWRSINERSQWKGTIWNRKKNGDIFPEWLSISVIKDARGFVTHYLGAFSDLSHKDSSENHTHLLAYYDNLTGLPNRILLSDRLKLSIAQAKREMKTIAICNLDLYLFKSINDAMGHAIGDQVLIDIASRLSDSLRDSDTVARLGGDDFCVIIPGIKSHAHATAIAEKILECFNKPIILGQREFHIGASIGISLFPDHGNDPETLLRHADSAMHRAKEAGNNRFYLYDKSLISKNEQKIRFENELCIALQENQLELLYQPQIDITTGKVVAIETFVRWEHETFGKISPIEFISIANETGLIFQLGNWILDNACKQMVIWRELTKRDIQLCLNVSTKQLSSGRYPQRVSDALQNSGLPSEALELEITENSLSYDYKDTAHSLKLIKDLGVQIAIDGFGVGHASLCKITDLSINKLKINKSLTAKLSANEKDQLLIKTIINLANNLYLKSCASGVETREQFHTLRALGCDYAQGFLIHQPMNKEVMTSVLMSEIKFHEQLENDLMPKQGY